MDIKILQRVILDRNLSEYKTKEQSEKDGTLVDYNAGQHVHGVHSSYKERFEKFPNHIEIVEGGFSEATSTPVKQTSTEDGVVDVTKDDTGSDVNYDEPSLDELTVEELKKLAKEYQIPKYGNMNKASLIEAITLHEDAMTEE